MWYGWLTIDLDFLSCVRTLEFDTLADRPLALSIYNTRDHDAYIINK